MEQDPAVEGLVAPAGLLVLRGLRSYRVGLVPNGKRVSGVGDGVRLRWRRKALEGKPQERIRHETRPIGSGR